MPISAFGGGGIRIHRLFLHPAVPTHLGGKGTKMQKKENLQTNNSENKQYYIPMEVTAETIKDFGINPADVVWAKIGNRKKRVIMIAATEEQYKAYMRPLWCEDKRQQRQEPMASLDKMYEENEYETADTSDLLEADVMKKMLIDELHKVLDGLEEIDRTIMEMYGTNHSEAEIGRVIGMSQKGVNKRKHRILLKLKTRLKNFE
jgi:RNA polymerase sigma factor (sigma-70 family)